MKKTALTMPPKQLFPSPITPGSQTIFRNPAVNPPSPADPLTDPSTIDQTTNRGPVSVADPTVTSATATINPKPQQAKGRPTTQGDPSVDRNTDPGTSTGILGALGVGNPTTVNSDMGSTSGAGSPTGGKGVGAPMGKKASIIDILKGITKRSNSVLSDSDPIGGHSAHNDRLGYMTDVLKRMLGR